MKTRKPLDLNIDDFQLYDELDEYGISDEDEDFYPINEQNDDTISFASTPRPQIKPYFDTTSFGLDTFIFENVFDFNIFKFLNKKRTHSQPVLFSTTTAINNWFGPISAR